MIHDDLEILDWFVVIYVICMYVFEDLDFIPVAPLSTWCPPLGPSGPQRAS